MEWGFCIEDLRTEFLRKEFQNTFEEEAVLNVRYQTVNVPEISLETKTEMIQKMKKGKAILYSKILETFYLRAKHQICNP